MALALHGDARSGANVLPSLDKVGRWAGDVFKACQSNMHGAVRGNLEGLGADTARVVEELR